MQNITKDLSYADVQFAGHSCFVATAVLQSPGGIALIDPGPSSCLGTLRSSLNQHGMKIADVRAVLLTHIHLDHAGATGSLLRENPKIAVYVHEKGASHMVSPDKLLASAGRLYGSEMNQLFGEFLPVPKENIKILAGGERIDILGRQLEVAYIPGHASHHVAYFDSSNGVAFVGDTAGMRLGKALFIAPPTPPPDINIEEWVQSVEIIRNRRPSTLFLTHFGPYKDVEEHLDAFLDHLLAIATLARGVMESKVGDDEQLNMFVEKMQVYIQRFLPGQQSEFFNDAPLGPLALGWLGLLRYWRKKGLER
jgi:glyoxylase-like metal-dependent hydrolase (beta-lactamase superfamily II)